jgi:hypothetical protein
MPGELETLAVAAPSRIVEVSEEREAYEHALFGSSEGAGESAQSRRVSLLLLLHASEKLGVRPDPDEVRWHLFRTNLGLSEVIEEQRLRWEAYHAQDLFQLSAAALLAWAIALMGEVEEGLQLGEIEAEVGARLRQLDGVSATIPWQAFRGELVASDQDYESWSADITARRNTPESKIWAAIRLLAALQRRVVRRPDLTAEIERSFALHGNARSIRTELAWFREQDERPVADVIGDYVVNRVVRRHNWVAMQKLRRQRDYTFLFEVRDGRLAKRADYLPVPTTPRLAPAIQFLVDVHLIGSDGPTARGRALLGANR